MGTAVKPGAKEILTLLSKRKEELKKRYGVREIAIFGSYLKGEETKTSDVDILVEFKEVPDLLEFISLEQYLESLLNRKVDLVRKSALRPELRGVLSEAVQA